MIRAFCFIGFSLLALAGHADTKQDIAIKFSEIEAGSSVTYRTRTGEQRTHFFEGPTEDGYAVSYWNGPSKGKRDTLFGTGYFNKTGQMIRLQRADGRVVTYAPHNCFRVVGTCSYTALRSDGQSSTFENLITPMPIGFFFRQHRIVGDEKILWSEGSVTLDDMGMMKNLIVTETRSPTLASQTQERADYR